MSNSPASVLGHSAYPRARPLRAFGAIQIVFDAAQALEDLHVPYTLQGPIEPLQCNHRLPAWRRSHHQRHSARTELPFQCKKSPELRVRPLLPDPALQRNARQFLWRQFLGYARRWTPPRQSSVRTGTRTAGESVEMGKSDSACVVWKASQSQYASLITTIWGAQSFAIHWPSNVATVCAKPGPPPANDPLDSGCAGVEICGPLSNYRHQSDRYLHMI
jgi:hypothetical protein